MLHSRGLFTCLPTSPGVEIGTLDRRIPRVRQGDRRTFDADIAKEVGLGPASRWSHTKRLARPGGLELCVGLGRGGLFVGTLALR